jgi:hypothetical protein
MNPKIEDLVNLATLSLQQDEQARLTRDYLASKVHRQRAETFSTLAHTLALVDQTKAITHLTDVLSK